MSQLLSPEKILIVPLINMLVLKNVVEDIISFLDIATNALDNMQSMDLGLRANVDSDSGRCCWYRAAVVLSPLLDLAQVRSQPPRVGTLYLMS